ncbi:MAG: hypothetical protein AVDCRST_MAG56-5372, partial [uncultured Cytophagales bacterium]
ATAFRGSPARGPYRACGNRGNGQKGKRNFGRKPGQRGFIRPAMGI